MLFEIPKDAFYCDNARLDNSFSDDDDSSEEHKHESSSSDVVINDPIPLKIAYGRDREVPTLHLLGDALSILYSAFNEKSENPIDLSVRENSIRHEKLLKGEKYEQRKNISTSVTKTTNVRTTYKDFLKPKQEDESERLALSKAVKVRLKQKTSSNEVRACTNVSRSLKMKKYEHPACELSAKAEATSPKHDLDTDISTSTQKVEVKENVTKRADQENILRNKKDGKTSADLSNLWKCCICSKMNSTEREACSVCGRQRGYQGVTGKLGQQPKPVPSTSKKADNKLSMEQKMVNPKDRSQSKYFKQKVDYEENERETLVGDISGLLQSLQSSKL